MAIVTNRLEGKAPSKIVLAAGEADAAGEIDLVEVRRRMMRRHDAGRTTRYRQKRAVLDSCRGPRWTILRNKVYPRTQNGLTNMSSPPNQLSPMMAGTLT